MRESTGPFLPNFRRIRRSWLDSGYTLTRQSAELLKMPTHVLREGGLWNKVPVFGAMLGSTADTCTASAYGAFEEAHTCPA